MELALAIGGCIVFIGLILYIAHYVEKKRTAAMMTASESMGFLFTVEDPALINEHSELHLFSQGHSKTLRNVISGERSGVSFKMFDYRYTVGSGKNSSTIHQTVVSIQSSKLSLPTFSLRPENVFHKIGQKFGFQDIDFDSHSTFSKKYLLRGDMEPAIRDAFQPHILDHFEANLGEYVEGSENRLIFYRSGKKSKPEDLTNLLETAIQTEQLFER